MNRIVKASASLLIAVTVGLAMTVPSAYAARGHKVDCAKVMAELHSGKKPKEVAKDLKISRSSVYRCRSKARKAAKAQVKTQAKTQAKTEKNSTKSAPGANKK